MLEYNEKNQSLALIIVWKEYNSLCNSLEEYKKNWQNGVHFSTALISLP